MSETERQRESVQGPSPSSRRPAALAAQDDTPTPLFEIAGLHYAYDGHPALCGVDLAIERGTRVVLLGANGSGKSTFLRLLNALDFAQQGVIRFDGLPITADELQEEEKEIAFRRRVGLVFQNPEVQLFNPTVFDELAFAPLQLGWSREEILRRIAEVTELMELGRLTTRAPHHLSMGEKKRVAIASVLVASPEVLLLDEPTAALDPKSQSQVIDLLAGWTGGPRTTITATHDLAIVEDIADVCAVFDAGRIVATGTPWAILENEALLRESGLLHQHRHVHAGGVVHTHAHVHRHADHEHR